MIARNRNQTTVFQLLASVALSNCSCQIRNSFPTCLPCSLMLLFNVFNICIPFFFSAQQGRLVETIELTKPLSGGLGFSVVGLKSENRGELGIFVQEIQEGSVAHR